MRYKEKYSLSSRLAESAYIRNNHPDLVPVIVESNTFQLSQNKYLVKSGMSVGNFMYQLRGKQSISPVDAMFIYVDNNVLGVSIMIRDVYAFHRDEDGFLYLRIEKEATFG